MLKSLPLQVDDDSADWRKVPALRSPSYHRVCVSHRHHQRGNHQPPVECFQPIALRTETLPAEAPMAVVPSLTQLLRWLTTPMDAEEG